MLQSCLALNITAGVNMAMICHNIMISTPRWMSHAQTFLVLALFGGMTILRLPCMRNVVTVRPFSVYSFSMLMFCGFVSTPRPDKRAEAILSEIVFVLMRVLASTRYHELWSIVGWNMAYFVLVFCTGWVKFADERWPLPAYQICSTVVVISLSVVSVRRMRESVRREMETATLRSESSGMRNLLDLVCDVVIPLDEDLRISCKDSRFPAMVMMPGKDVEGLSLTGFMPSMEDRAAFEKCAAAEETEPRAIHIKLRDGLGNLIPVELFCVRMQPFLGKAHLIGIREFTDCMPIPECKRFDGKRVRRQRAASPASDAGSAATGGSSDETVDEGIQLAIVNLMRMLSVSSSSEDFPTRLDCSSFESECCPFHARIARVRRCVRRLSTRACLPRFKSITAPQCSLCGLLVRLPDSMASGGACCFACGSRVEACGARALQSL